jgi:hypothetical protein
MTAESSANMVTATAAARRCTAAAFLKVCRCGARSRRQMMCLYGSAGLVYGPPSAGTVNMGIVRTSAR